MNLSLFIIILSAFSAAVVAVSWIFARLWCKPKKTLPGRKPDSMQMDFEKVAFKSQGVDISGWYIPALSDKKRQPVIIITHGWSGNSSKMLPIARVLNKANYNTFMFDFRGHGASGSDGPITLKKFAEDIIAGVDYIKSRTDADTERLAVFGHSMGGSGVILAASMDPRIRALISCSAFASPAEITISALKKLYLAFWPIPNLVIRFIERWIGTSINNIAPCSRIGKINVPILLVHGGEDKYVLPSNLDDLYKKADPQCRKRLLISGRSHFDLRNDPKLHQNMIGFLNTNLPVPVPVE